jgi:hypothetical protein
VPDLAGEEVHRRRRRRRLTALEKKTESNSPHLLALEPMKNATAGEEDGA